MDPRRLESAGMDAFIASVARIEDKILLSAQLDILVCRVVFKLKKMHFRARPAAGFGPKMCTLYFPGAPAEPSCCTLYFALGLLPDPKKYVLFTDPPLGTSGKVPQ